MKTSLQFGFFRGVLLMACLLATSGVATAATQYLVTNDDIAPKVVNSISFYAVAAGGVLTLQQVVSVNGLGIGGGFFGPNRIAALNTSSQQCIYASMAFEGEIAGINVATLKQTSLTSGSMTDGGTSNGMGLAMNSQYLYASFTDSNTIGTFAVTAGCGLTFVKDVTVGGLAGGIINGLAIRGNMMIVTYTDGSIESFGISGHSRVERRQTVFHRDAFFNGRHLSQFHRHHRRWTLCDFRRHLDLRSRGSIGHFLGQVDPHCGAYLDRQY